MTYADLQMLISTSCYEYLIFSPNLSSPSNYKNTESNHDNNIVMGNISTFKVEFDEYKNMLCFDYMAI